MFLATGFVRSGSNSAEEFGVKQEEIVLLRFQSCNELVLS